MRRWLFGGEAKHSGHIMRIVDEENNCGKGGKVESKNRAKNEMAVAEEEEEVDT